MELRFFDLSTLSDKGLGLNETILLQNEGFASNSSNLELVNVYHI